MPMFMTPSVAIVLGQIRTIAREANTRHAAGFPDDGKRQNELMAGPTVHFAEQEE